MTATEIRAAIVARPEVLALLPDTQAVADALSVGRTTLVQRMITERRIISALGLIDGDAFLTALEGVSTATLPAAHPLQPYQSGLRRVIAWLKTDEGLDVGDPLAQQMLTTLSQAGVLSVAHAETIKALARVADPVSEFDVRRAVFADDGTLIV